MQEIFNNLTNTQILLIVLGAFLVSLSFKDSVLSIINSLFTADTKNKPDVTIKPDVNAETDLTSIVAKWETLSDACKDAGLSDAYNKLQEVFPMLAKIYKPKEIVDEKE